MKHLFAAALLASAYEARAQQPAPSVPQQQPPEATPSPPDADKDADSDEPAGNLPNRVPTSADEKSKILADLYAHLATADSPNAGRDLHIGDISHDVVGPISHVGAMVPVMAGAALAFKMRGEPRIAMTWVGDGSTKTGEFYEGMNVAAALGVPLVVVIQNNQVALGTLLAQHHKGDFAAWPAAFGVEGWSFDGNNVLDAYAATKLAADACREGRGRVDGVERVE